ncbi:MAG: acyl-ACP--UDP-N-acetylglucosamine O-acyltransferase [Thermodesulfobacteriota bacterium]
MAQIMIHPTAIIGAQASLGENVSVGPYAIIEDDVFIDSGTHVGAHAYIDRYTRIGKNCLISPFAAIGTPPQDKRYKGEKTEVIIGDDNVIREYVTIHRGTPEGPGKTRIGNQNLLMAYCHVAHDCQIGNGVVMANVATLGGHVIVEDYVNIGGLAAVQQFGRVGAFAFIGGKSAVVQDIPPYVIASGDRAKLFGLNIVGLKRHHFPEELIAALKKTYQIVIRSHLTIKEAMARVEKDVPGSPEVTHFLEFINTSQRGVPRR